MLEYELKRMVNNDIDYCLEEWEKHSFDWEAMGSLFEKMICKYSDIIDGFDKDLKVISAYERKNDCGDTYRYNLSILIKRLEAFRDNGYKNEGLHDEHNADFKIEKYDMNTFNEVRLILDNTSCIDKYEKAEISEKLDEIETICSSEDMPTAKWGKLRPYLMWLSGKNLVVASQILSVIMEIGNE